MDQKGQISIEFVLIIAFMLVLVLLVASYAGEQNELNTVLSAARSGATDAITNLDLVNRTMIPERVNDIRTIGSGHNLTIQINISGPLSGYQTESIINGTLNSIVAQGYIRNTNSTSTSTDDFILTSRHRYNVTII
jgi:uncharacterized protein (UPF0333 family)